MGAPDLFITKILFSVVAKENEEVNAYELDKAYEAVVANEALVEFNEFDDVIAYDAVVAYEAVPANWLVLDPVYELNDEVVKYELRSSVVAIV
jgi:hypothetical protein